MLHFFKFSSELPAPIPARDAYVRRGGGRGWPEECPPIRAANGFGFDVVTPFEMVFLKKRGGGWKLKTPHEVVGDWSWTPPTETEAGAVGACEDDDCGHAHGEPQTQVNAWFWDRNQKIPHVIGPKVWHAIRNQVKVSTFLYLRSDQNELILLTDIPNLARPFRVLSAVIDTDWYPASYPWHAVIELDDRESQVVIPKGEPLCRLMPVRRDTYFAREMTIEEFDRFFERGQAWLARHGKGEPGPMMDITGAYVRQQQRSSFHVIL